jgi:TetR/AcrR family transcriptional repressor of nem operon
MDVLNVKNTGAIFYFAQIFHKSRAQLIFLGLNEQTLFILRNNKNNLHFKTTGRIIINMLVTNKKQIKRDKLLNQGVQMLMTQGYHGTGLKEMLDTVQIPKGSFYNYFGSKEEFAAEAITHYIDPFIQRLNSHLQNPQLDGLAALKCYFNELIIEVEQAGYKGGCLLGNLMGEMGDNSKICRRSLLIAVERYSNLQQTALIRAQKEGTVRKDRSAKVMADLLTNCWQGALLRMKIEQSVQPLQECCQLLLDDYFKP